MNYLRFIGNSIYTILSINITLNQAGEAHNLHHLTIHHDLHVVMVDEKYSLCLVSLAHHLDHSAANSPLDLFDFRFIHVHIVPATPLILLVHEFLHDLSFVVFFPKLFLY